jgi:CRISPR-associated protein (TIGR03986 family)
MSQFRNPYHFIPLGDGPPPESVSLDELRSAKVNNGPTAHLTHDRFLPNKHSGRVVCKLTVETPLICGNQQEEREGWTTVIHPFESPPGQPALPGSALRGMLSTLVEAASHSAMRVLKDTALSHRMAARDESLSAIGLLVTDTLPNGEQTLRLQPLTVPTLDRGGTLDSSFRVVFQPNFHQPLLKAFVDGYQRKVDKRRRPVQPAEIELRPGSFIAAQHPASKSADRNEFWYAELQGAVSLAEDRVTATAAQRDSRNDRFLLGQRLASDPISQTAFDALLPAQQKKYIRGFLRILGITDRTREMPTTKKHEYFIPYPHGSEATIPTFEVAEAIERFHSLADQRTETDPTLPFEVAGSSRNGNQGRRNRNLRLRPGDLVFFRPNPANPQDIAEVSVSSIWRAGNGSVHQYFSTVSTELKPLAPGRNLLTLAEQLFGVVEIRDDKAPAFALASRLRVSHGRLANAPDGGAYQPSSELLSDGHRDVLGGEVLDIPLKNLASPKPPSPSLYFKKRDGDGAYIHKKDLNPTSHAPQGIKLYLRRDPATYRASSEAFVHPDRLRDDPQRKAIARQHQSVEQFVRPGTTFYFHLDFDNLTDLELQLLAYVLQPTADFRHQLGHGRPLGLGQVKIEIAGLLEVDRRARYRGDLAACRWHHAWVTGNPAVEWPEAERRHLRQDFSDLAEKLNQLKSHFETWAGENTLRPVLRALELLGTPPAAGVPVHYPQTDKVNRGTAKAPNLETIAPGSKQFEQEHYHWFVLNDDTADRRQPGQFLGPLINASGQVAAALPVLDRTQRPKPPPTGYSGPSQPRRPSGGSGPASPSVSTEAGTRSQTPGRVHISPQDVEGKEVDATAGKREKDERVPCTVNYQGKVFSDIKAYVDMSKYERAKFATLHPEGRTCRAKVIKFQHRTFLIKILPT